ncbi:MAG: hypothetical protein B7Z66_03750 [Chromatiales bacterium 21-64-14]|nr:MAG: hypothetical protein B7Z66_03750 [Chromatiales bacterium 21-64-14]HQU14807.1 DUF3108 domain-containing protein [Gammaproteobacteria bacterium]
MNRRGITMVLALLATLPGTARADCDLTHLPPFAARYQVTALGGLATVGEYRISLTQTGADRFRYETVSHPVGIVAWFKNERLLERSDWTLDGQAIRPEDTLYQKRVGDKNRVIRTTFDWPAHHAVQVDDGRTKVLDIHDGVLDRILFQVALMRDLIQQRTPLEYRFVDKGRLKTFRFKVMGRETVGTPMGDFEAVKLKRVPLPGEKADYVWAAPRLCYLPVRIAYWKSEGPAFNVLLRSLDGHLNPNAPAQARVPAASAEATVGTPAPR